MNTKCLKITSLIFSINIIEKIYITLKIYLYYSIHKILHVNILMKHE